MGTLSATAASATAALLLLCCCCCAAAAAATTTTPNDARAPMRCALLAARCRARVACNEWTPVASLRPQSISPSVTAAASQSLTDPIIHWRGSVRQASSQAAHAVNADDGSNSEHAEAVLPWPSRPETRPTAAFIPMDYFGLIGSSACYNMPLLDGLLHLLRDRAGGRPLPGASVIEAAALKPLIAELASPECAMFVKETTDAAALVMIMLDWDVISFPAARRVVTAVARRAVRWFNANELSALLRVATVGRGASSAVLGRLLAETLAVRISRFDDWERSVWHPNSLNSVLETLVEIATGPGSRSGGSGSSSSSFSDFGLVGSIAADELALRMHGGRERAALLRTARLDTLEAAAALAAGAPSGVRVSTEPGDFAERVAERVKSKMRRQQQERLVESTHSQRVLTDDAGHGIDALRESLLGLPLEGSGSGSSSAASAAELQQRSSRSSRPLGPPDTALLSSAEQRSPGDDEFTDAAAADAADTSRVQLHLSHSAAARVSAGLYDPQRAVSLIPRMSRLARAAASLAVLGVPATHPFWTYLKHVSVPAALGGGSDAANAMAATALWSQRRPKISIESLAHVCWALAVVSPSPGTSGTLVAAAEEAATTARTTHTEGGSSSGGGTAGAHSDRGAASIASRSAFGAYGTAIHACARRGELSSLPAELLVRLVWALASTGRWTTAVRAMIALVREATQRISSASLSYSSVEAELASPPLHVSSSHAAAAAAAASVGFPTEGVFGAYERSASRSRSSPTTTTAVTRGDYHHPHADALDFHNISGRALFTPSSAHVARLAWCVGIMGPNSLPPSVITPFFAAVQSFFLAHPQLTRRDGSISGTTSSSSGTRNSGSSTGHTMSISGDAFSYNADTIDPASLAMLMWGCAKARAGTEEMYYAVADAVVADTVAAEAVFVAAEGVFVPPQAAAAAAATAAASSAAPSITVADVLHANHNLCKLQLAAAVAAPGESAVDAQPLLPPSPARGGLPPLYLRLHRWRPAEVSMMAWALATAGVGHDGLFSCIARRVTPSWYIRRKRVETEGGAPLQLQQHTVSSSSNASAGGYPSTAVASLVSSAPPTTISVGSPPPMVGIAGGLTPAGPYGGSGGIQGGRAVDAAVLTTLPTLPSSLYRRWDRPPTPSPSLSSSSTVPQTLQTVLATAAASGPTSTYAAVAAADGGASAAHASSTVILHRDLTTLLYAFVITGQLSKHPEFIGKLCARLKSALLQLSDPRQGNHQLSDLRQGNHRAAATAASAADADISAVDTSAAAFAASREASSAAQASLKGTMGSYFSAPQLVSLHTVTLGVKRHNGIVLSMARAQEQQEKQAQLHATIVSVPNAPPPFPRSPSATSPAATTSATASSPAAAAAEEASARRGAASGDRWRRASFDPPSLPLITGLPEALIAVAHATALRVGRFNAKQASAAVMRRQLGVPVNIISGNGLGYEASGARVSISNGSGGGSSGGADVASSLASTWHVRPAGARPHSSSSSDCSSSSSSNFGVTGPLDFVTSVRAALIALSVSAGLPPPLWEHMTSKALLVDAAIIIRGGSDARAPPQLQLAIEFEGPQHFLPPPLIVRPPPLASARGDAVTLATGSAAAGERGGGAVPPVGSLSAALSPSVAALMSDLDVDDNEAAATAASVFMSSSSGGGGGSGGGVYGYLTAAPRVSPSLSRALFAAPLRYDFSTVCKHDLLSHHGWAVAHVVWKDWARATTAESQRAMLIHCFQAAGVDWAAVTAASAERAARGLVV